MSAYLDDYSLDEDKFKLFETNSVFCMQKLASYGKKDIIFEGEKVAKQFERSVRMHRWISVLSLAICLDPSPAST